MRAVAGRWCALRPHPNDQGRRAQAKQAGQARPGEPTIPPQRATKPHTGAVAEQAPLVGHVAWRCAVAIRGGVGCCWVRALCPAGRALRRVLVWCWRLVEPFLRDATGWVVHTAPGAAVRLLWRLVRWLLGALLWIARHAMVGLGWLLVRLVRYLLAYPEYAGVVREARELDKPRRAR